MRTLLKSELTYNKYSMMALLSLPLIYTVFLTIEVTLFDTGRFWGKYFWSGVIGLGTYFLVYIMWVQRVKEKRDRLHATIPVSIKEAAYSRALLGLIPFIIILFYILLIHFLAFQEQSDQAKRIIAQLGFMFIFMAHLLIWRDLWFGYSYKSETRKFLFVAFTVILMVIITVIILFYILIPLVDGLFMMSHETMFISWGLVLCGISYLVFKKAGNYAA